MATRWQMHGVAARLALSPACGASTSWKRANNGQPGTAEIVEVGGDGWVGRAIGGLINAERPPEVYAGTGQLPQFAQQVAALERRPMKQ